MALEVFNYPYHTVKTENPESGLRIQLGKSYVFTAPPTDPDQRKITLNMKGMQYFTDIDGELDDSVKATRNMFNLIKFYQRHKMYKSFQYNHPVHGVLVVKFNQPLVEEEPVPGGSGVVKDFSIELIEIP